MNYAEFIDKREKELHEITGTDKCFCAFSQEKLEKGINEMRDKYPGCKIIKYGDFFFHSEQIDLFVDKINYFKFELEKLLKDPKFFKEAVRYEAYNYEIVISGEIEDVKAALNLTNDFIKELGHWDLYVKTINEVLSSEVF